ncbi:MAG: tetratricopeptide repeat protein [Armatimonadetes bacterium]|nr:tetratricopeptide repeat protein [Armatimonadota bacterium]
MTGTWRLVVVATAALYVLLPGPSAIAQDDADSFVAGIEAYQRGEYDRAIDDLSAVVEAHPDWEAAWYYLGLARFQYVHLNLAGPGDTGERDYSGAIEALEKAAAIAPSRPGTALHLGRIYEAQGKLAKAKEYYRQELSLKNLKDRNAVHVALARVAYAAGEYQDTIALTRRVVLEEPYYVEARYYLGQALTATGEYQEAIETLKYARETLENWRDKVFHLLRIHYQVTDPDDPMRASDILEAWDQLRKELWELRGAKARPRTDTDRETLEQVSEKYARAQEFALDLHMWPELNKALGDAYAGLKDWAAMRNSYRHAMRPQEGEGSLDDADAWARIGRGYFLHGKEIFEQDGLLLSAIFQWYAAEGDKLPPPSSYNQQQAQGTRGFGGFGTAGLTTATQQSQDPKDRLDGYARALYVLGIPKDAKLREMQAPPQPDPLVARIFDGLGQIYLYQASTYATDKERGIESHTFEEAAEAFDKALLYMPTYVPAMLHKAQAWISHGETLTDPAEKLDMYAQARDLLEQEAIALEPENGELWSELSRAYLGLDELDKADQAARKALAINKDDVTALNVSGLVKYYRNKLVAAVNDFATAIETAPKDYRSYLNLGNALFALQSWGRAEGEYVRALELLPKSSVANTTSQRPYVLYLIGRARHERKAYEKTIEILNEALELRTDFADAYRLLAASYAGLEQWAASEEALKAALKNAPKADAVTLANIHAQLAQVYEVQGRFHEASAEYRIALAKDPDNIAAKYGLQRLLVQEKREPAGAGS